MEGKMEQEIMKRLLEIEIASLMKQGVAFKDAVKQAGDKMKEDMEKAEFETYCNEHDC